MPFRFALCAAVVVSVSGCRLKGLEGFTKATSSRAEESQEINFGASSKDPARAEWGKYSNGGIADATGGLNSATRYGTGAKKGGAVLPGFDEAGKGSGNQPGEYPNVASAGHAQTNAPGLQPSASDTGR